MLSKSEINTILKSYNFRQDVPDFLSSVFEKNISIASYDLYEEQLDLLEEVFNKLTEQTTYVLELPTGYGKSLIAVAITLLLYHTGKLNPKRERSLFVCNKKLLQTQYHASFPFLYMIKGKSNYICPLDPKVTVDHAACSVDPEFKCSCEDACTYQVIKSAMVRNPITLVNYAWYFLHRFKENMFSFTGLQVFDEAHLFPGIITDFMNIDVNQYNAEIKKSFDLLGFSSFNDKIDAICSSTRADEFLKHVSVVVELVITEVKEWMKNRIALSDEQVDSFNYLVQSADKFQNTMQLTKINDKISFERVDGKFLLHPLSHIYNTYISETKYNIFMTSTIEEDYATNYLFEHRDPNRGYHYIQRPSLFKKENRQINVIKGFKVNNTFLANTELAKQLAGVATMIADEYHKDERGLIFVNSYKQSLIFNAIKHPRLFVHLDGMPLAPLMEKFLKSKDGILVSPVISEGFDFKNEDSRFQIIFKIPFLTPGTPEEKVYGSRWYFNEALNKLIQMTGRSIRNKDDYAVSYVLDENLLFLLSKVKPPLWWTDSINYLN